MPAESSMPWDNLFRTREKVDLTITMRVLKRAGRPFLLLPLKKSLAARSLPLYPAQTGLARLARGVLQNLLRMGMPVPLSKTEINLARSDAFPRFLVESAGVPSQSFPAFAILCGNPRTAGRRFILLLLNEPGRPVSVVKAGVGESARQLILRETEFLQSLPPGISGLPAIRKSFASDSMAAFALDFVDGDSPRVEDQAVIGKVLTAWLDPVFRVRIAEIPPWQAVEKNANGHHLVQRVSEKLADASFHPAMFHGDFAPWNVKVSPADGSWKVLDWERAERIGPPGWDWFHYVIQTGILVEKLPAEDLVRRLEVLLNAAPFRAYAEAAGIVGSERALALAYLLYCNEIIKPTEGAATSRELLSTLAGRWMNP